MQSVSSRIWTRVAVSISYTDNHYTTAPQKWLNWPEKVDTLNKNTNQPSISTTELPHPRKKNEISNYDKNVGLMSAI